MSTCPIPAVIDRVMVVLGADAGLGGVTLRSGKIDATGVTEILELDDISIDDDQTTMGRANRTIEFTIQGIIEVVKYGAGETFISSARSRCFAILDEVESALIAGVTVSGVNLQEAELIRGRYVDSLTDGAHRGHLEFTLRFIANLG